MPRRVTLLDLARAAGVGKSTVSRALANHPTCAKETRDRIQKLATEMGYVPDPALSALVSHRANARRPKHAAFNLAIMFKDVKDRYISGLWAAVKREAARLGYDVQEFAEDEMESPAALGRMLHARGVRGIVWSWLRNERFLSEFPWERFAHVGFLLPVVRPSITRVRDDAFRSVTDAVEACFARGFKRPGLALMTAPGSVNDRYQKAGWLLAHAELAKTARPIWRSFEKLPLSDWVRKHDLDVVIGNVDGVHWSLRSSGIKSPDEVAYLNLLHPGRDFPGFDCREDQIGRVLINVLDRQIRHNDLGLQENPATILVRRRFAGWDARHRSRPS